MTQTQAPKVLVIGSGGIAGLYGALLHKTGWQVELVARSDYQQIRQQGMRVDSVLGDLSFQPAQVYASVDQAAEQAGQADWILIAVKMLPTTHLAQLIAPAVGANTKIALIANGLDVEQPLADVFPNNPLVSCVAFVCSSRLAPGHIHHSAFGGLIMGGLTEASQIQTKKLAEAFSQAGIKASLSENIALERWKKSIWNASFNPLSVLTNGADTGKLLSTEQAEQLVRAIMAEVIATGRAAGFALADELIDRNLANTRAMPPYLTSMALDYLHSAPIELEAIVGTVVAYAKQHKVEIPHLETVYQTLKLRE